MFSFLRRLAGRIRATVDSGTNDMYTRTHDAGTGLYNQYGFEKLYSDLDHAHMTVIKMEPSDYRSMTGEQGELSVKKLAETVKRVFRPDDHICRVDESVIAVIMEQTDSTMAETVLEKIEKVRDECGPLTAGVAFGDRGTDLIVDVYKAFLKARVKGRNAFVIYPEKTEA